jgi:hypothetical protein
MELSGQDVRVTVVAECWPVLAKGSTETGLGWMWEKFANHEDGILAYKRQPRAHSLGTAWQGWTGAGIDTSNGTSVNGNVMHNTVTCE